jgi:hypothetical protein
MGLVPGSVKFLLAEAGRRPYSGTAITLGRQDVSITWPELESAAEELGVPLTRPARIEPAQKPGFAADGYIADRTLFTALGFERLESLDASDFEGADHIFDLNSEELPADLRERFDLVVDGGTLEHVFHLPNALANVHALLRAEGRVIHLSPSSNYVDHGFWMFSPTLFRDYYLANGWAIETLRVFRHTPTYRGPWSIYEYGGRGADFDALPDGALDDAMYGICCVATKKEGATASRVPQQNVYARAWARGSAEPVAHEEPGAGRHERSLRRLAMKVRNLPRIGLRRRLGIKPIARY